MFNAEGNSQEESPEVMWGISVFSKRTAETTEWEGSSYGGKKKLLVPPLFLLGGNQSRVRRHFFTLKNWKKHGKHEEDLLLYPYEEICQAQGGFSCPPKVLAEPWQAQGRFAAVPLWRNLSSARRLFLPPNLGKQNHGKNKEDLMLYLFHSRQISVKILHVLLHLHEKLNADWLE